MADLKLAKLPDRTPVKITFTAQPDLNRKLQQYAALYRATYGETESVAELIPFMLESFLESDRAFAKAQKDVQLESLVKPERLRGGRKSSSTPSTTAQEE
jgi:hypothetical protein